jgi:NAD(P)-dependent dehydrogenase (short-subunit alcohol dehydrogenase family)
VSDDLFSLRGRVAVVVGGSGAIGRALAAGLGRAGAAVALLGRREEPLQAVAGELGKVGVDAVAFPADTLDLESLSTARGRIEQRWGAPDLLLNASGGNVPAATLADGTSPFDLGLDAYREVQELNLIGPLAAIKVFGPALAASSSDDRAVVNVSSMAALRAMTRVGGYGAAKAALDSVTRWLAVELARGGAGIRVNAIAPGFFHSRLTEGVIEKAEATIKANNPIPRVGLEGELKGVAVFLAADASNYITGQVIVVDGGRTVA